MNNFFILMVSIALLNCFGKDKSDEKTSHEITTKKNDYVQLNNRSSIKSNKTLFIVEFIDINQPLSLILFKETERAYLRIDESYFNINWFYRIEKETIETKEVLVFKKDFEYLLLIPTYSEEFTSFQMVGIKNKEFINYGQHTYSYEDFKKLEGASFDKVKYEVKTSDNTPRINAVIGSKKIKLSDYSKIENNDVQITPAEKKEVKELQNQNVKKSNVQESQNIFIDIDSDGKNEDYEISFKDRTIKTSKNFKNQIYFDNNKLIIEKEIHENNPHDLVNYKYYFQDTNNSVTLEKVEYKRNTYVEKDDLCKISYTYLSNEKIHLSEVSFFDQHFLQLLIRNISLNEAIEIATKINKKYNCTSNLTTKELDFLLTKTILDKNSLNNYNNLAFYLEQNQQYETSGYLLDKIIKKYPNRVVAWLNLGDVYFNTNKKNKAKEAYLKYILFMRSHKKEASKIPQRVYDRSR